ncbi:hypothetical protein AVEN_209404-1 [Araneus ventricosus]|uniref:CID domain-containing protein n=1 Tax=Araneus ventricosus TaxID=182803 RepID=A0A4Y2JP35_ARAVE|nr:hypothetical protein AVEN_209404-1 [Araneus ventricosus]
MYLDRDLSKILLQLPRIFSNVQKKLKVLRVLKMWKRKNVFPIDVIQTLIEMGRANTSNERSEIQLLERVANDAPPPDNRTYAEKLLDFEYGDEEEAKNDENNLSNQPNALVLRSGRSKSQRRKRSRSRSPRSRSKELERKNKRIPPIKKECVSGM